ncbi:HK97-gp10 family putative phage morphogenesis protein [Jannaschia sp. M317]|uniref:HK97-gp10 family putative phage morphogenesis protein n=1 Tax=Jannaschia sp. M317 TaxID=2867011 RepID=UPI0021A83F72|nr:HK97-gp10 family putative phage morphogenesis protein [Jannaschia sp. M317]UWQ16154.1 HK97 gp10 family phage protein [Jannaschia sp. M317]
MTGMRELERNLERLKRSTRKAVGRRVLKKAAEPVAQLAADLSPYDEGDLEAGLAVSHRLSRRDKLRHPEPSSGTVEMFIGPAVRGRQGYPYPQAIFQEFGSSKQAPQPFLRPAWESERGAMLDRIGDALRIEIAKTLARVAARARR